MPPKADADTPGTKSAPLTYKAGLPGQGSRWLSVWGAVPLGVTFQTLESRSGATHSTAWKDLTGHADWADFATSVSASQQGDDVLLRIGADTITLLTTLLATVDAGDFI